MPKPLLLLDVDGVLCPFRAGPGYEPVAGHHIFVAQENGVRIRRLMESFDVAWCTTWENDANTVISPLHNLPAFPVVPLDFWDPEDPLHPKRESIRQYVRDRPYAFVDDEIPIGPLAVESGALWVPVKCYEGLTDEHVELLEKFAQSAG